MKHLLFLLLPFGVFSQNSTNNLESKIEKVSVFLNGAQVERSAKTNIQIGRSELVFSNLSPQLEKQSIQLKSDGSFTILSVVHQFNSQNEKKKQEETFSLEKQKQQIEEKIKAEKYDLLVYKREEDMLLKNHVVGGTYAGTKIADLKEAVEYQRIRMKEALQKQLEIEAKIKKLEEEIRVLNQKLTAISTSKEQTLSEIVVVVSSKEIIKDADFSLSYFVQNAGWMPTYDIRVDDISKPINLAYKANIYQYSGEDWKDVKLNLSTANPRKTGTAPILQTWNWGFSNDYSKYFENMEVKSSIIPQVSGKVRSSTDNYGIPGVSVRWKGTSLGVSTDENGNYKISIPPNLKENKVLVFSFIGFSTKEISNIADVVNVDLEEDAKMLQEVSVIGYGISTQKKSLTGSVTRISQNGKEVKKIVEEKESPTSKNFEILLSYSIPSDGKTYTVEIKEESLPATYQHFSIPKIDADAFLNAQVLDWEKYNLLEGETSIYFEGTYIGKSQLNLSNSDTLNISLGRDKNVVISRIRQKEFQKRQFIGSNKIDIRKYEIVVRNTKQQPINLMIEDQFPVSNYRSVEIDEKTAPEAEIDKETGKITWKFEIEASKQKKMNLGFTVKSPKSGFVEVD